MAFVSKMTVPDRIQLVDIEAAEAQGPRVARSVRGLKPYDPVSSLDRIGQRTDRVPFKLDWNESTIPPSPKVAAAIQAFLLDANHLNWYPDLNSRALVAKLQDYACVPASHLLVTSGSDDALALICRTFLDPEEEVLVPVPTYTHFLVFAQEQGGKVRQVRGADPFVVDESAILQQLHRRTKLVYFVSPNNPTGCLYSSEFVEQVAAAAPNALIIVDEAYYEFGGITAIDLTTRLPNVVVTRTFSKSWGLAGLRVGYLAADPRLIRDLHCVLNPKSVNALGQIAAMAALDDLPYLADYVEQVRRSKELLLPFLREHGIAARSTPANFILLESDDPAALVRALESVDIYVRDRSSLPQMERFVRMSIANLAQTEEIIARLRTILPLTRNNVVPCRPVA